MTATLTICIPTYQRHQALGSLLQSICTEIEFHNLSVSVLISDNCSTDKTQQVAEFFASKYSFVAYHRNERNLGGIANFDLAICRANTTHCWLMGDDSILNPGSIKHVMDILTDYPNAGLIFLDGNNLPSSKGKYLNQKYKEKGLYFEVDDLSELLNSVSIQALGCISALVVDRSEWEKTSYKSLPAVFFYNQINSVLEIMSRNIPIIFSHKLCFVSSRANESHNDWYIDNAPMSVLLEWPWYRKKAKSLGFVDNGRGIFKPQFRWKLHQLLVVVGVHPYFKKTYEDIVKLEPRLWCRLVFRILIMSRAIAKPVVRRFRRSRFRNESLDNSEVCFYTLPNLTRNKI